MDNELLQYMSIIAKVSTMVDGGNAVTLHTNEMTPQQTTKLFSLKGKPAWTVHKPNEIVEADIPEIDADIAVGEKSPTKRLYNVLYRLWEQQADKSQYPEFEVYRVAKMERIIDSLKEKLE